ncbi:hypothetical protein [Desulfosporosinus sp. FKB]|uniref:hypothetical protein n=1 Tax=Desulfosporosinus sp. FKB TaxID=1969835 RepID=UPI000B4A5489|nr:hypothetical protein [Desulfosporosinus sp. FKB]
MNDLISVREYANKIDEVTMKQFGKDITIDLDFILEEKKKEFRSLIENRLEDFIVLFDIALKLSIQIHEICKKNNSESKTSLALVVLSAKIVTMMISIRTLLYSGMMDGIKCLQRSLIETINLFFSCLSNKEFSNKFANKEEMYDNDEFWNKNISRGKLNKDIVRLFSKLDYKQEFIDYFRNRRNEQQKFLSNSIHSSFNSSFSNFIMITLDFKYNDDCYGKVTTAYPNMILSLLEDINILSMVFYDSVNKKISEHFLTFDFGKDNFVYCHFYNQYKILFEEYHLRLKNEGDKYSQMLKEAYNFFLQNQFKD